MSHFLIVYIGHAHPSLCVMGSVGIKLNSNIVHCKLVYSQLLLATGVLCLLNLAVGSGVVLWLPFPLHNLFLFVWQKSIGSKI